MPRATLEYLSLGWTRRHIRSGRMSRREFVQLALATGVTAVMAEDLFVAEARAAPKAGGSFKAAIGQGASTDSLDPTTWGTNFYTSEFGTLISDQLLNIDQKNALVPRLAESFTTESGATKWVFKLRKGVTFLNGKTMTDAELRTLIEDRMTELLGRDVDVPEPDKTDEETTNTLIFGDTDAVRFIVDQGELTLVLRAGLKRDAGDIPVQLITVPMSLSITDEGIAMKRGQVGVKPLPGQPPANVAEQVARARIMISKIEAAIKDKTVDNTFSMEQGGRKLNLKVTEIIAQSGWLTILAE